MTNLRDKIGTATIIIHCKGSEDHTFAPEVFATDLGDSGVSAGRFLQEKLNWSTDTIARTFEAYTFATIKSALVFHHLRPSILRDTNQS